MAPISKKWAILGISDDFTSSSTMSASCSDSDQSNMAWQAPGSPSDAAHHEARQFARVNRVLLDKNSDEYRQRRERNNLAVKRSRTKSKIKTIQTAEQISLLRSENEHLLHKVNSLSRELRMLKEIFMAHASNAHGADITEMDLNLLINSELVDSPYREVPRTVRQTSHQQLSHLPPYMDLHDDHDSNF